MSRKNAARKHVKSLTYWPWFAAVIYVLTRDVGFADDAAEYHAISRPIETRTDVMTVVVLAYSDDENGPTGKDLDAAYRVLRSHVFGGKVQSRGQCDALHFPVDWPGNHGDSLWFSKADIIRLWKPRANRRGPLPDRGRHCSNDAVLLGEMETLVEGGLSMRSAATQVADRAQGSSLDAKIDRLRTKYAKVKKSKRVQ